MLSEDRVGATWTLDKFKTHVESTRSEQDAVLKDLSHLCRSEGRTPYDQHNWQTETRSGRNHSHVQNNRHVRAIKPKRGEDAAMSVIT
jgi:hypothetical protein